jgi:hypothetical protein
MARRAYRTEHPTEIAALKCMDGRINLPVICQVPPGIIQPYRNIAGKFDIGWAFFGEVFDNWVYYAMGRNRKCLVFVTYHWSEGNEHRGCKGFGYDRQKAMDHMDWHIARLEETYGNGHAVVYPIKVGIETDSETMILHGRKEGAELDLSKEEVKNLAPAHLRSKLQELYPDMQPQVVTDLLALVLGNLVHAKARGLVARPDVELDHCERVIGVGRGFGWLHLPNKALIIGPYGYDMGDSIAIAAGIIKSNIASGRVPPEEGIALMTSGAYRRDVRSGVHLASQKARSLADYGYSVIEKAAPELLPYLVKIVGTTDLDTLLFTENPA